MKNLQFNPYQHGTGRVRVSLKSLNSSPAASTCGTELKSRPILSPPLPPLRGEENRVGQSREERIKRGGAKLLSLI